MSEDERQRSIQCGSDRPSSARGWGMRSRSVVKVESLNLMAQHLQFIENAIEVAISEFFFIPPQTNSQRTQKELPPRSLHWQPNTRDVQLSTRVSINKSNSATHVYISILWLMKTRRFPFWHTGGIGQRSKCPLPLCLWIRQSAGQDSGKSLISPKDPMSHGRLVRK